MEKLQTPLARGLVGHKDSLAYAQMEIYLADYNTVNIKIRRKPYSNLPDVEFSIQDKDLQDLIDILEEAKRKLDTFWLSKEATAELKNQK